jgi:hypothetical protein
VGTTLKRIGLEAFHKLADLPELHCTFCSLLLSVPFSSSSLEGERRCNMFDTVAEGASRDRTVNHPIVISFPNRQAGSLPTFKWKYSRAMGATCVVRHSVPQQTRSCYMLADLQQDLERNNIPRESRKAIIRLFMLSRGADPDEIPFLRWSVALKSFHQSREE